MFKDIKKTFIVAELSANHNNDFDFAVKTIEEIAKSGADAVKIQTFKPESLTLNMDTGAFKPRETGLWKGMTPWQIYVKAAMPYSWQPKLKEIAESLGLTFFSTPFDLEAVDFLEQIGNPIYKIASLEINDHALIKYVASKNKPIIFSTGAAGVSDIIEVLNICKDYGNLNYALLKCTSEYPAPIEKANLLTIPDMAAKFNCAVGLSDHTLGSIAPVVAVSLGAKIIEKHFILDRSAGGLDSAFSMEPEEFTTMVKAIRTAESALGQVDYTLNESDKLRRRSLYAVENIQKGETLTAAAIRSLRPGLGMEPKFIDQCIGKKAKRDVQRGEPLSPDMLE